MWSWESFGMIKLAFTLIFLNFIIQKTCECSMFNVLAIAQMVVLFLEGQHQEDACQNFWFPFNSPFFLLLTTTMKSFCVVILADFESINTVHLHVWCYNAIVLIETLGKVLLISLESQVNCCTINFLLCLVNSFTWPYVVFVGMTIVLEFIADLAIVYQ